MLKFIDFCFRFFSREVLLGVDLISNMGLFLFFVFLLVLGFSVDFVSFVRGVRF